MSIVIENWVAIVGGVTLAFSFASVLFFTSLLITTQGMADPVDRGHCHVMHVLYMYY